MITVLNYGSGNVQAITNIYHRLNVPCRTAATSEELASAKRIVLPGVGAFDETMELLGASGMLDTLNALVLDAAVPVLGICVGMQVMAQSSEEGELPGLGWIDARVRRLSTDQLRSKPHLPHMGWNNIRLEASASVLDAVDCEKGFYFLHSFCMECAAPENILATADYGETFTAAVVSNNIYGVQFHPEKSHGNGIQVFRNFAGV